MLPEETMRELVSRYAGLLSAHGEAFEGAELVTPSPDHFPDKFERDADSVARLLGRIVSYTPLAEDVPLQVTFLEDESDDGHCTSGCSKPGTRVDGAVRVGAGYRISVPLTETSHPTRLVCALVRGVSAAVVGETGEDPDDAVASEIVAAACGFGVILLEGSHVYTKSCGGPSIHQGTRLGPEEHAFLLALFCALHELPARVARKHLGATQTEAFDEAASFMARHQPLIEKLREAPELLEAGAFSFETKRGLLSRLRGQEPAAPEPRRASQTSSTRLDPELEALIDKEFG